MFKKIKRRISEKQWQPGDLLVWLHYLNGFPIALLGAYLEFLPGEAENTILLEALDYNERPRGVGCVNADCVFPILFADNVSFDKCFGNMQPGEIIDTNQKSNPNQSISSSSSLRIE